jgi:hypothetical protein
MSTIAEQFTKEQLVKVLEINERWKWLSYAILPLLLLIKTQLIATVINIGTYFYDFEISYSKVYNIVLKSEFVFLFAIFAKGAWFYFFQTEFTILDFQNFYPLSLLNIVDYKSLEPWMVYPFQTLNLFEVAYITLLTFFMKKALNISFLDSFLFNCYKLWYFFNFMDHNRYVYYFKLFINKYLYTLNVSKMLKYLL